MRPLHSRPSAHCHRGHRSATASRRVPACGPDAAKLCAAMTEPVPTDEGACNLLARCPIFRHCGPDDLTALAACARWVEHADGADIVREGDPPLDLLVIQS